MTPEQLQAIAEREKRATPGPWAVGQDEERASRPEFVHDTRGHVLFDGDEAEHDDLQFAAYARTDIPALLELVREQARELERLRSALIVAEDALFYPENGHHHCRGCNAGTTNGWKHETECSLMVRHERVENAMNVARAALAGGEEG
jgi:hypothetical protein